MNLSISSRLGFDSALNISTGSYSTFYSFDISKYLELYVPPGRMSTATAMLIPGGKVVEHPGCVDFQYPLEHGSFGVSHSGDVVEEQGSQPACRALRRIDALGELHGPADLPLELLDHGLRVARRAVVGEQEHLGFE